MTRIRVIAAGAVAAALGAALVSGPATAAEIKSSTPEHYAGDALGRALNLSVLGNKVTLGGSLAKAGLDPAATDAVKKVTASASGAGQLAVLSSTVNTAADLENTTAIGTEKCAQVVSLPAPVNVLNAGLACGVSSSKVVNDLPQAVSEGRVAGLNVTLNNVLATTPIGGVLDTVLTTVAGLTPEALNAVDTTLSDLVDSAVNTETLKVTVGKSTSSVIGEAGKVTSAASADGAKIEILPTPLLNNVLQSQPVATIAVSSSSAKAVYDRASGVATPSFDAALVTVRLAAPLTNLIGGGVTEIKVAPGETVTILQGTPLESTIIVADGSVTKDAATGAVRAVADGVALHLLKGISGGILLELAHSEAGVLGAPAVEVLSENIRAVPTELPRTGGAAALPLIGSGLFVAALAFRRLFVR